MKPDLRLRLHTTQAQPCFPAASNALALPGGNGIFTATPTERITHYTLLRKVVYQMGALPPLETPTKKRRYATPPRGAYRLFLLSSPPAVSVEQKSAWDWCGIFNFWKPRGAFVKDIYRLQVMPLKRHICTHTPVWRQKRRRGLIKKDCFGPLLQTLRCSRNSSTSKADSFLFVL